MISANGGLPAHRYTPQVTPRWPRGSEPASHGSNHGGAGARVGGKRFHVEEWRSKAPTMVGVASLGKNLFDVGEWRSKAPWS